MYTIKTRDTQQQQNPNIQYPNVVENNTNQTYKENVEDKFNVEQTIQKHRYFNFKIRTNYFKNDIIDNIKITYKPVNKEFELSQQNDGFLLPFCNHFAILHKNIYHFFR